ncbi:M56 family metallopeptidase [Planctomyces sp. SH-PL14]|uniref:M56 family metallopeptidase n=1 Tax=Planctomyces sp. SH-PL14 TaxID=1632864 RepID=UPI00078C6E1D|nr:M56 family metallopeptidase [Planctomyces sp. SH-PL14]AMV20708.1 Regulatory protein BlaR1 [Planctomyces sp. SH-PL14]
MFPTLWLDSDLSLLIVRVLWGVTWSGTLVAAAALATSRLLARQPSARYLLQSAALLAIVLLVPLWTVREWGSPRPLPRTPAATAPQPANGTAIGSNAPPSPAVLPAHAIDATPTVPGPRQRTDWTTAVESLNAKLDPPPAPVPWDRIAQGVTVVYLAGVLLMLARLTLGLYGGERLKSGGHAVLDPELRRLLETQARRLGLAVLPALRACERTTIPVVVGLFRPVILFPAAMLAELPPGDIAGILLHELAHLRRYDHIVLLFQRLIEAVLFFHPAVWLLSRAMSRTREECCDDLVLSHGGDAIAYAQSLLRVAELRLGPTAALTGLSMAGTRPSELRRRIMRVLGLSPDPAVRLTRGGLATVLGAVTVTAAVSMAWLAAAERPKGPSDAPLVEFDNGLEVEFLGLSFHPSAGRPWWKPDGTPLEQRPYEESGSKVFAQTPEEAELCREWAFEFRKLPTPFLQERVIVEGETLGAAGGRSCKEKKCVLYRAGGPVKDRKSTTVRIGFAVSDDLPPRLIDPQGRKTLPGDTLPAVRLLDNRIRFQKVEETADTVELVLDSLGTLWDDASFEFFALDADGKETRPHSSAGKPESSSFLFKLAPDRLQSFGYRLRPYTHWVTFRNVSLSPDHPTQLKVETEVLARYIPALATVEEQREVLVALSQSGFLVAIAADGKERVPAQLAKRPLPITECSVGTVNCQRLKLIGRLIALEKLDFIGGGCEDGLAALASLKQLRELRTGSAEFQASDFAFLRGLTRLEVLEANTHMQLAHGIEWYRKQVPELTPAEQAVLDNRGKSRTSEKCCYDAFLNDRALETLESLPNFKRLELSNAYLTDVGFRHITSRKGLVSLKVSGAFLTEEGLRTIRNCPDLEELDIGWAPWTEAALDELAQLKRLKSVRFWSPSVPISPASLDRLRAALPGCQFDSRPRPTGETAAAAPHESTTDTFRVQFQNQETRAPIPNAEVTVQFFRQPDAKALKVREAEQWNRNPIATATYRSDKDGRIEVTVPTGLPPAHLVFVHFDVRHPEYRQSKEQRFHTLANQLVAGPASQNMLVDLVDPGIPVSGQVLGIDGMPAANVPILGGSRTDEVIHGKPDAVTDSEGRYQVRVPRLSKRLYVLPENAAAVSRAIDLNSVEQAVFRLRQGTRISGRVVDDQGRPLTAILVRAKGDTRTPYRFARTDADGHYALPPVPAGEYDIRPVEAHPTLPHAALQAKALLPVAFLGQTLSLPRDNPPADETVDLRGVESVRITVRAVDSKDQPLQTPRVHPAGQYQIAGTAPGRDREGWFGGLWLQPGPDEVYVATVPKGLRDVRIDASSGSVAFDRTSGPPSRVDRLFRRLPDGSEGPASIPSLDGDDDSLVIRRVQEARLTLKFLVDGREVDDRTRKLATVYWPTFVDPARRNDPLVSSAPFHSGYVSINSPMTLNLHPGADLLLKLTLRDYQDWTQTIQLQEGEERTITVNFLKEPGKTTRAAAPPASLDHITKDLKSAGLTLRWTRRPSVREGSPETQVRMTISTTGEAKVPKDYRNRDATLQFSEAELKEFILSLLEDYSLASISGDAFNQPPNLWETGVERIEVTREGRSVDLSRTGGWSHPDESIRNYLGAVDRLARTVSFVRAGGKAAIEETLPAVNEGLLREFPQVAPFTASDFMAAEALEATGSRVLTFRRERTEGDVREEVRADIEIPLPGAGPPNLLSVERNGDRRHLERPPVIPGIPLAGVPVTGKWSSVTAVYVPRDPAPGEVGQFYRLRDGIRTVELTPTLDAHILPGGRELYIEHADPIRRNLYGPITGDAESLAAAARGALDAVARD